MNEIIVREHQFSIDHIKHLFLRILLRRLQIKKRKKMNMSTNLSQQNRNGTKDKPVIRRKAKGISADAEDNKFNQHRRQRNGAEEKKTTTTTKSESRYLSPSLRHRCSFDVTKRWLLQKKAEFLSSLTSNHLFTHSQDAFEHSLYLTSTTSPGSKTLPLYRSRCTRPKSR